MPALGGNRELLDPYSFVAVDSSKAEEKLLESRETPDDVIRRAQAKIGISGGRCEHQQYLGVLVRFTDHFQAFDLMLIDQTGIIGLHCIPTLRTMANKALVSSSFVLNRSCASSCACLSAAKNPARSFGSGLRGILPRKRLL